MNCERHQRSLLGFSLVELSGVLALLAILLGGGFMALGNAQARALQQRVAADLARFNQAKAVWRAQHPTDVFATTESGRFSAILVYLGYSADHMPTVLSEIQPAGVVYTLGAELVYPSAVCGGLTFNPATEQWQ